MTYYLSKTNKYLILPFLRLLKNPENGKVELPSNDSSLLIGLLKNAAGTEFPELKRWKFKILDKETVIAIPRFVVLKQKSALNEEELDYLGLIAYLIENQVEDMLFTKVTLTDKDFNRLMNFANAKNFAVARDKSGLRVINVIQSRIEGTEANRDSEG